MNHFKLFISILLLIGVPKQLNSSIGTGIILHDSEHITLINNAMLYRIFTLQENRWPNGALIKVYIMPLNSTEHRQFLNDKLNLSLYRYKSVIDNKLYSANETNLHEVSTKPEMISTISKTQDSIGYINNLLISNNRTVIVVDEMYN